MATLIVNENDGNDVCASLKTCFESFHFEIYGLSFFVLSRIFDFAQDCVEEHTTLLNLLSRLQNSNFVIDPMLQSTAYFRSIIDKSFT